MKKIVIFLIALLLVLILVVIFFVMGNDNDIQTPPDISNSGSVTEPLVGTHMGINIEDILNEEHYNEVGINPEDFEYFEDFLVYFGDLEGIDFDPLKEAFVIGIRNNNGDVIYTQFDNKRDWFGYTDNEKNIAILDIYKSYKDGEIFGSYDTNSSRAKILFPEDFMHPMTSEIDAIKSLSYDMHEKVDYLENIPSLGKDASELLTYLYEFSGDYEKGNENREKTCGEFSGCEDNMKKIIISGITEDTSGVPIPGVHIELLNDANVSIDSDSNGHFKLEFMYDPFGYVRLKSTKEGYSNGYANISLNIPTAPMSEYSLTRNFIMHTPKEKVNITDANYEDYLVGNFYEFKTEFSRYLVPTDGMYFMDGRQYMGHNFDVYMYEFNKWYPMDSLLENDTFDDVLGYVGDIMKTFGMPYIQFIDIDSGEEVFVKSSNPMILQTQVQHMKELYENYDKIYEPITNEDMQLMYEYSQNNEGYPIDLDYLLNNMLVRWPARWALDRKAGTWDNVGMRLLNTEGLVELPFYSIKDN